MVSWLFIASLVLATVVLGAFVAGFGTASSRARRMGDPSPTARVTMWIAGLWAAMSLVGALVTSISTLVLDDVTITVPVDEFWPQLPSGTELAGMSAEIVGGGFTSAEIVARGLSLPVRIMWSISQALSWLVPAAIAVLLAITCRRLLVGRPFAPLMSRLAVITGVLVAVGGSAAQVLGDVAGGLASSELLRWASGMYPSDIPGIENVPEAWWPSPAFEVMLPFWPIAAGLAFAALGAVFRYGSHLQRDTEGLV